ncbi:PAAR domain-containing protein [Chromobacterium haemolyticum]|uniref:PAAR domain-containing protein n=1 Tax=Chromobacterium fluminis TaxID=3044269 RepID=A0ABX0LAT7_9NEIS|nr:PAAR domain-containing protein [Chromobacterium haemolyticum]NHR04487.1 PAAR domain-containing protein [Chromobacterium haemolyticum]
MGKPIIREGDTTSHGGTVLEAFPKFSVYGKNASGIGHQVYCPKCKGSFPIVAGAANYTFMGKNVAVEGMQTSCGAVLIASQAQATVDNTPGGTAILGAAAGMAAALAAESVVQNGPHWIEFALPEKENYSGMKCTVNFDDGSSKELVFNENSCARIDSISEITGVKVEFDNNDNADGNSLGVMLSKLMG